MKKQMPEDFEWECQAAIRAKKRGKAKGGIISRVKTGITENKEDKDGAEEAEGIMQRKIFIQQEEWKIITVYSRNMEETKKNVEKLLNEMGSANVLLGGDFNARIGEKGARTWMETRGDGKRRTKDRTENKDGRTLWKMVMEHGMEILNGNKIGDEEGEFTYVDSNGASVIDYGIVNEKAWEKIKEISIGESVESDHMPLEIKIENKEERREKKEMGGRNREIIIWGEDGITKFKERMTGKKFKANGVEEKLEELEETIKESLEKKRIKEEWNARKRNEWWDKECMETKRAARKKLRQWRRKKGAKEEYIQAR